MNDISKMAVGIRDRLHTNVYLFDDLVPLVFRKTAVEKRKYETLVVQTFIQNVAMCIQSNSDSLIPLLRMCGFLAGVHDCDGIVGLACMNFLATLATGSEKYKAPIIKCIIEYISRSRYR